MNGYRVDDRPPWYKSRLCYASLGLLGIVVFIFVSDLLEHAVGLPVDTSYRAVCAAACLVFIYKLGGDYHGERWPQISLWLALLVNVAISFTPLVNRPASRGELMLFALPDSIVVLVVLIACYRVENVHQRAMRQQMVLALVFAIAFCAALFTAVLFGPLPIR